jgi:hypothetical protein
MKREKNSRKFSKQEKKFALRAQIRRSAHLGLCHFEVALSGWEVGRGERTRGVCAQGHRAEEVAM